jgi:hypothetical protein
MCHLAIELIKRLEKHKRILPEFIESQQEFIFNKAPDEMIELIILVASYQPGFSKKIDFILYIFISFFRYN